MHFAAQVAAPAGVGAEQQAAQLAQLRVAPFHVHMQRHLVQLGRNMHPRLHAHRSGVGHIQIRICTRGLGTHPQPPVARIFLPEREVGAYQRVRQLLHAALEVDARIGGCQIGQPYGIVWSRCARSMRGAAQNGIDVPRARRSADKIQAGFVHSNRVEFQLAAPQRHQPDGSAHGVGVQHRLRAIGRIFVHGQVSEFKAGPRQQPQLHRGEAHRPPQRTRHQLRDLAFIAADGDVGRHQHHRQQQYQNCGKGQPKLLTSARPRFYVFAHECLW